ncbi:MAG: hypothetical protein ACRC01_02540, partial [Deefgea sp.]
MQYKHQVQELIFALSGSHTQKITFQVFFDPKKPKMKRPDLAATWTDTLDASVDRIEKAQKAHCGVHMTVNATDGEGRKASNITQLRAFFVDFDGKTEPNWVIPPHIVQKRDETHGHAFWLIDAAGLSNKNWTAIQKRLAFFYETDANMADLARTIRLPGTWHFKDPSDPQMYMITSNRSSELPRYTADQITQRHPLAALEESHLAEWLATDHSNLMSVGYEHTERELLAFTRFAENG